MPNIVKSFENLAVDSAQTTYISLAASGSQTITLNGTSNIQAIYLLSDAADVSVNMNSLGNITLKQGIPSFAGFVVTSLSLVNQSASVATNVTVILISG